MSYSASQHQASNKSYGVTNKPDGARTYLLDFGGTFAYRPFLNKQEVLDYFPNHSDRVGHFSIIINVGGSLNSSGVIIGGRNTEWWWKDGTADNQLVEKFSEGGMTITLGEIGSPGDPLTINWEDTVPDETVTYQEKHGDIESVLVQLLIPNGLITDAFSPSLNWAIKTTDPQQLILDVQGATGKYIIIGKGVTAPIVIPLFNGDNELQDEGILIDSEIYNLS